ncbi:MAG: hypothetical protein HY280_10230 [Nitrospinae bacterium]|nr:hypothetical protein [Nitrospinota bacterium]
MKTGGFGLGLVLALALAFAASCTTPDIEKAFDSDMKAEQSDKIIVEYCQSCHNHKKFISSAHYEEIKKKQPDSGNTVQCRVCHTYSKNWIFDIKRGTHRMKEPK